MLRPGSMLRQVQKDIRDKFAPLVVSDGICNSGRPAVSIPIRHVHPCRNLKMRAQDSLRYKFANVR